MKQSIFFCICIIFASACNRSAIGRKLSGCDSLVITFNLPDSDSVLKSVSTTDTKAIQKMARFLGGKEAPLYKCGFEGSMLFFRNGQQVLPVVFKYMDKDCRHFSFDLDNKVMSTSMSAEAIDFLISLSEGRSWY